MTTEAKLREAFEKSGLMAGSLFRRRDDRPDEYWDGNVQDDWLLWQQAALSHPTAADASEAKYEALRDAVDRYVNAMRLTKELELSLIDGVRSPFLASDLSMRLPKHAKQAIAERYWFEFLHRAVVALKYLEPRPPAAEPASDPADHLFAAFGDGPSDDQCADLWRRYPSLRDWHKRTFAAAEQPQEPEQGAPDDIEAIIACLGDDAATLREESPEIADNMDAAAAALTRLATPPAPKLEQAADTDGTALAAGCVVSLASALHRIKTGNLEGATEVVAKVRNLLIARGRELAAPKLEPMPAKIGDTVMMGDEIFAGIFEDDVRPVSNSVLIQFDNVQGLREFLQWHHGISTKGAV
jgi:hypothetical protein